MLWKNRELNKYPKVILSDCFITKIEVEENDIILEFSKYGFFILDEEKNKYYRTDGAQIRIEGCNIDNISFEEIRTQKLNDNTYFKTMYDVDIRNFIAKVNSKEWAFEIVEEYYAGRSGFFTAMMGPKNDKSWCYIKLQFKNLIYQWNHIQYDWPY